MSIASVWMRVRGSAAAMIVAVVLLGFSTVVLAVALLWDGLRPRPRRCCIHCGRTVVCVGGRWVDPQATGDDSVWREICDAHDTFTAEHEVAA